MTSSPQPENSANSPIPAITGESLIKIVSIDSEAGRYPLKCQWEITSRCNLKCVMCYTDCHNTLTHISREIETSEILRIMDEMKEAGVMEMAFTGGEPLSHPDFPMIYEYAVKSGFLTDVFTNGTLINEDWISLWKRLPPERIEISYHAAKAPTFDQITAVAGSFDRVNRGIRFVVEAGLPLTLKTTALPHNYEEILEIKQWVRTFPNARFRFGTKIRRSANGDEFPLQYQVEEEKIINLLARDPDFQESLEKQHEDNLAAACPSARRQFHIDACGMLQLCSSNRLEGFDLKKGSFVEGFYRSLPLFPCPHKKDSGLVQLETQESRYADARP